MSATKWTDPFEAMSDDDFDDQVAKILRRRNSTLAVSLRIAPDLLVRVKREAVQAGLPYQTLMSGLLEAGISRLERGRPSSKSKGRGAARTR